MSDVRVRTRKPVSRRRERVGGMSPVATPKLILGESPGPRITVPEQFPIECIERKECRSEPV